MNWVELIAELRARGYSQAEIAEACGCKQPTISELATGKTSDPRDSIGQALRALFAKSRRRKEGCA